MSRHTPQCPAASACSRTSSFRRASTLWPLSLALLLADGCYTGVPDTPDGDPWHGQADGADDAATGADDADSDGAADSGDGAGDPSAGDPTDGAADSGGDPSGGDPSGGDPSGGDPSGGDPTAGDPTAGDPTGGDPTGDAPPSDDVPDIPYCDEVAAWDPAWAQLELDVLELVNQHRAAGANCGSEGSFGPAAPLTMNTSLRCAARKHSKDMNDRMFFDHTNPSGESPWDRMEDAGYSYTAAGENIAGGSPDAAGTMNQWMNSDGHCSNIMNPAFEEIGVGYYPGGQWGHLWTQAFGAQ